MLNPAGFNGGRGYGGYPQYNQQQNWSTSSSNAQRPGTVKPVNISLLRAGSAPGQSQGALRQTISGSKPAPLQARPTQAAPGAPRLAEGGSTRTGQPGRPVTPVLSPPRNGPAQVVKIRKPSAGSLAIWSGPTDASTQLEKDALIDAIALERGKVQRQVSLGLSP